MGGGSIHVTELTEEEYVDDSVGEELDAARPIAMPAASPLSPQQRPAARKAYPLNEENAVVPSLEGWVTDRTKD